MQQATGSRSRQSVSQYSEGRDGEGGRGVGGEGGAYQVADALLDLVFVDEDNVLWRGVEGRGGWGEGGGERER